MKLRLSDIKIGKHARIVDIDRGELKAKFMEMGLLNGKELSVEFKAPLGDPIAIEVGGALLALRIDEAACITVETVENE